MPMSTAGIRPSRPALALAALLALRSALALAADAPGHDAAQVQILLARALAGSGPKELEVLRVQYPAGGSSPPHRHHAQVIVYVLEGSLRMQIAGAAPVTLGPGQVYYEGPEDEHVVSANASRTQPARFLVVLVRDPGATGSTAGAKERP